MYGSVKNSNNNGIKPTTFLSYEGDTEIGQNQQQNRLINNNNKNNNNNQSVYARLVTFMIVILSLLAVVTLSAGAYVGKSSSNNISNSVDTSVTTTTTDSIISTVVPDNIGIINTASVSDLTYNPTPTALFPTPSPVEEIDINIAKNIVKEVKEKKEVKEAQNKGKLVVDEEDNTSSSSI